MKEKGTSNKFDKCSTVRSALLSQHVAVGSTRVVGRATRTQRGDNSECMSAHTGRRCLRVCRCTCLCKYACHLYIRPLNSSNTHQLSHYVCTCPHLTGSTVQFIIVCVPVYMNICSWYILTSIYASIMNYHITQIIRVSCSSTNPQTASHKRKRKEQKNKSTNSSETRTVTPAQHAQITKVWKVRAEGWCQASNCRSQRQDALAFSVWTTRQVSAGRRDFAPDMRSASPSDRHYAS